MKRNFEVDALRSLPGKNIIRP
jgi:hypothetical protein